MNRATKTLASALTLFAVSLCSYSINADEYRHILSVARKVETNIHNLEKESLHYRHVPQYVHLLQDSREIDRLAHHIYDLARAEGSIYHLKNDVEQLDRQFHHLKALIHRIEFSNSHVHGNTKHVERLLNRLEDNLHHLQEDVQKIARRTSVIDELFHSNRQHYNHGRYQNRTYRSYNGYGSSNHGRSHSGFSFNIGGGSSRIRIDF